MNSSNRVIPRFLGKTIAIYVDAIVIHHFGTILNLFSPERARAQNGLIIYAYTSERTANF